MVLQTVLVICGSCCLLLILASCMLTFLGWLLRYIRPRRRRVTEKPHTPNDDGDVIEGEYKEMGPKKGET